MQAALATKVTLIAPEVITRPSRLPMKRQRFLVIIEDGLPRPT